MNLIGQDNLGSVAAIVMSACNSRRCKSKVNRKIFSTARGLMGEYYNRKMLARDGGTIMNDTDEFGAEWQVHEDEPKLFRIFSREPQHPHATCKPVISEEVTQDGASSFARR
jgi:hypothetical protein